MSCALILRMATLGTFGGPLVAAHLTGLGWRAAALGTRMHTRGRMAGIGLEIGLDLRGIAPPRVAMLVVMARVTTMATAPLPGLLPQRASAPATARTRVTPGRQPSSATRADRRQAEGPFAGHQH